MYSIFNPQSKCWLNGRKPHSSTALRISRSEFLSKANQISFSARISWTVLGFIPNSIASASNVKLGCSCALIQRAFFFEASQRFSFYFFLWCFIFWIAYYGHNIWRATCWTFSMIVHSERLMSFVTSTYHTIYMCSNERANWNFSVKNISKPDAQIP